MLDILAITGPIYITIALGYFLTRRGLFARADMRVLGQFVINLALPALLFNALAQRKLGDILNGRYMLVYAIGSLATMGLGLLWARRGARQDATVSVFYAMGMCCSNSGFVGYPIALLVIGPVAGVMLGLNMIVENLLLIPLLLALAESSTGSGGMLKSRKTSMVAAVSFACNVLRTRTPVNPARMAMCAVSGSRISPTMTTSGSCRRMPRRASTKPKLIFGSICT